MTAPDQLRPPCRPGVLRSLVRRRLLLLVAVGLGLLASCVRSAAADTAGAACDPARFAPRCLHSRALLVCAPVDGGSLGAVTERRCEDHEFCGRFGTKGFACISTH